MDAPMRFLLPAALLALSACSQTPEEALLTEAHAAIVAQLDRPDTAKFDDSDAQVFPKQGLICRGRIIAALPGGETITDVYAYSRETGVIQGVQQEQYAALSSRCWQLQKSVDGGNG